MRAVFCKSCCSLIGYFKGGIGEAIAHYGKVCPFCIRAFHPDQVEGRYQQELHVRWSESLPEKHPFHEVATSRGDDAPAEVTSAREAFLSFHRTDRTKNHPTEKLS